MAGRRGRKCALHSTVYKGQGRLWGRRGPTRVCSPSNPSAQGPSKPRTCRRHGPMEDSGPSHPTLGMGQGLPFSLCPLPASTRPTGGSTPPGVHKGPLPPPPGPTQSPPTDPRPTCPPRSAKPNTWGQEPFTHHLSTARIKPSEQAQRSQVTSSIHSICHPLSQRPRASAQTCLLGSHQRPSAFTRQACCRLGSPPVAHGPRLFPA